MLTDLLVRNLAENAIRPLAIGRKAFLFAGSHQAAEMTAAMYSFMATCKKNGVDEQQWLTDVLERIQSHKHKNLYQLLPITGSSTGNRVFRRLVN
ncbi:transposase domain-containing protein [Dyadobacter sp. CY261]|uniref:transposase domain-containing protein n=1 Tax=Dyadobacter sp. CY261 TaxID=2907203 RepID=UPI0038D4B494